MNSWDLYKLAMGDHNGVDKDRIDYALRYLYGKVEDSALDRFPKEEVLKATIWHNS